jgi:hypothetical protein
MKQLTPREQKQLRDALLSAFPRYSDLKPVVNYNLGDTLENIAGTGPLRAVLDHLVEWVVAQHKVEELIRGAFEENPGNPLLRAFAAQVLLMSPPHPPDGAPAMPDEQGRLERLVLKHVPFQHMADWRERAALRERAVCRAELPGTMGTGSLLGPDVVITNSHVLEAVIKNVVSPDQVTLRFDFKAGGDGGPPGPGQPVKLVDDGKWLVAHSPEGELDYAIVRVKGSPGDAPAGAGGPRRGWLTPVPHKFQHGEPFFVIQHPDGEPLQIAGGSVTGVDVVGRRVTYSANTLEGSSGAPCFTMGWDLIALHHYGKTSGNRGVLFESILQDLADKGLAGVIPAAFDPKATAVPAEPAKPPEATAGKAPGPTKPKPRSGKGRR